MLKAQARQTDELRRVLGLVVDYLATRFEVIDPFSMSGVSILERDLRLIMSQAVYPISEILHKMRRQAYILARVGEAEAIARAKGSAHYDVGRAALQSISAKDSVYGGAIHEQVAVAIDTLRRKILNRIQSAKLRGLTRDEFLVDVVKCFPKAQQLPERPKVLRKVKEADRRSPSAPDMAQGVVDDREWTEIVDEYLSEYQPRYRDPLTKLGGQRIDLPEGDQVYAWEIERLTNEELVWAVRTGQDEAAKENGITDMVWIAVVDDKTDECCLWRNGLTTTEIEQSLSTDRKDDECQAVTPPGHPNCRCSMAPVLDSIADKLPDNTKEFDEWLNS